MSRGPAILVTALALALVNVGLAALLVEATGARSFAPPWVAVVLLLFGVVAAVGAVTLWRAYLDCVRRPPSTHP
jgi:uncharacterized membrane protein (DUF2068 family)